MNIFHLNVCLIAVSLTRIQKTDKVDFNVDSIYHKLNLVQPAQKHSNLFNGITFIFASIKYISMIINQTIFVYRYV